MGVEVGLFDGVGLGPCVGESVAVGEWSAACEEGDLSGSGVKVDGSGTAAVLS